MGGVTASSTALIDLLSTTSDMGHEVSGQVSKWEMLS
jgi:hypothetical protein